MQENKRIFLRFKEDQDKELPCICISMKINQEERIKKVQNILLKRIALWFYFASSSLLMNLLLFSIALHAELTSYNIYAFF